MLWRGDIVTPGYNDRRSTEEKFVERNGERWLKSGAIGWMDGEGFRFLVDRLKDVLTTGCGDVYPREIEEVLYGVVAVEKVAAIDQKDAVRGATVTALVKARGEESAPEAAIDRACRDALERYEVPDRVRFVEEFPRTANGDIDRVALRHRFC